MGISHGLPDLCGDSLPIIFIAAAASFVSYIRSHFLCSFQRIGLPRLTSSNDGSLFLSRLQSTSPSFPFSSPSSPDCRPDCVVCLSHLADGEVVRKLSCCHVFHAECLDAWFCQTIKLSCPLCRSPFNSSSLNSPS